MFSSLSIPPEGTLTDFQASRNTKTPSNSASNSMCIPPRMSYALVMKYTHLYLYRPFPQNSCALCIKIDSNMGLFVALSLPLTHTHTVCSVRSLSAIAIHNMPFIYLCSLSRFLLWHTQVKGKSD